MKIIVVAVIGLLIYASYLFSKKVYVKNINKNRWDIIQTLTGMFAFIVVISILEIMIYGAFLVL